MKLIKVAAVLAALLAACAPANAETVVTFDMGGTITKYVEKYQDYRESGERLKIDGECVSACTLFLGVMTSDRYCITPKAELGFHSAWTDDQGKQKHSPEATLYIWSLYPKKFRKVLRKRGWNGGDVANNEHPKLIILTSEDLKGLIPPCR